MLLAACDQQPADSNRQQQNAIRIKEQTTHKTPGSKLQTAQRSQKIVNKGQQQTWSSTLGGGGGGKGARAQPAYAIVLTLQLKNGNFRNRFFDVLTVHTDQTSHVKHVSEPLHVLFTLFGCLDRGKGLVHKLLMQFSTLSSSKLEIAETGFFDILTIHNDQITYVKHVLDPLDVFFTLSGCWRGAEATSKGLRTHNLPMQISTLYSSKMGILQPFFLIF